MNQSRRREESFKRLFMAQFYPDDQFDDVLRSSDELERLDWDSDARPYIEPELGNGIKPSDLKLINDKVMAIREHIDQIDDILNSCMEGWKTSRLSKVDLTVLRLAVYEIRFDERIPVKVSINEAVELAKKYGTEKSGGFVNGVLRRVAESEPGLDSSKAE